MFYTKEKAMNTNLKMHFGNLMKVKNIRVRRGTAWGGMIIGALVAFEAFNYSTTQFALNDVLGDLTFAGLRWATILALAFCGIDFAGIARLFTPEQGRDEPAEAWYLFGAWLLAAAMNATLTWWGVAVAIASHSNLSSEVISTSTLTKVVPFFVAIMVLLIRILLIGTFSAKGSKIFSQGENRNPFHKTTTLQPSSTISAAPRPTPANLNVYRPAPKSARAEAGYNRPTPSYQSMATPSKPVREAEYIETPRNS
jgi:hypothetical protein